MDQPAPEQRQPRRIGVREFRGNITDFLRQVRQGSSFLITSHNEVVAEIHPPSQPRQVRRQPGALRGRIWMAPDFDTWPEGILDALEGKED